MTLQLPLQQPCPSGVTLCWVLREMSRKCSKSLPAGVPSGSSAQVSLVLASGLALRGGGWVPFLEGQAGGWPCCGPDELSGTGMGTQWRGMGLSLMRLDSFRESILRSDEAVKPLGVKVSDLLLSTDESTFDDIVHAFVSLTAIQVSHQHGVGIPGRSEARNYMYSPGSHSPGPVRCAGTHHVPFLPRRPGMLGVHLTVRDPQPSGPGAM